jgi:hypothetical protein
MLKHTLIGILLVGLVPTMHAFAQEIPESFVPVRPHSMGGAFTAIANDENAIWTNPAGIGRVRKARSRDTVHLVKFPNLILGANTKGREFIQGVQGKTSSEDIDQIAAQADKLGDKPFWANTSISPLVMFDFESSPAMIGGYSSSTLRAFLNEDNKQLANTGAISDVGGMLGLSVTDRSNRISFGAIARYVARYAYEDKVPLETLADPRALQSRIRNNANKSSATAIDMGFLWTFADFWFPTVGIAVLNAPTGCKDGYLNPFSRTRQKVCGTLFRGDFANEEAISTVDPTDVRYGVSITPRFGRKLAARIALDLHHNAIVSGDTVYGLDGIDITKRLHAGIELFTGNPLLPSPFSVALGLNQGFYTMGFSVNLGYLSLDFASFGTDISTTSKPREDRRLLGGLSVDF